MSKIGWGIIGPGSIVKRFLNDMPKCEGAKLVAVASRSIQKAKDFAEEYGFERFYGSYQELAGDKDVDVVYVATPHPFHKEQAMMCMEAGKSVLCEKPVAVSKAEIVEMIECAKRNNVFFMEGMWTRHFPVNRQVKELLDSGKLGKVTLIKADFGFGSWINGAVENKESRIFNMDLAGGALLDVGVYTVSYATWMKGEQPVEIKSMATKVETGADGMSTILLKYEDGAMAMLESSVIQTTKQDALIYCEKGYVDIKDFWHPTKAVVKFNDGSEDIVIEDKYDVDGGTGFNYEAQHVVDCMKDGLKESSYISWQNSIDVMETLDTIRQQINLVFPFENK